MENSNINERLITEIVNWSMFTEQDFERVKECAVNHTDYDNTPVQLLSDKHNNLQIEFHVKQLGDEWVLDVDAYNKTDEIMIPVTGYTEDAVKELKYDNMKRDVENGLQEELGHTFDKEQQEQSYKLVLTSDAFETPYAIGIHDADGNFIEYYTDEYGDIPVFNLAVEAKEYAEASGFNLEIDEDFYDIDFLYKVQDFAHRTGQFLYKANVIDEAEITKTENKIEDSIFYGDMKTIDEYAEKVNSICQELMKKLSNYDLDSAEHSLIAEGQELASELTEEYVRKLYTVRGEEEVIFDEDYNLEDSIFEKEAFHTIDPCYKGSPQNVYIEFLMEEVSLSLYEKLAEKTGLLVEMNCKTLEELEDDNNLVFLYANVYENGKVGIVLTYGNNYEHNVDLTEYEQKYLGYSIETEWQAKGEPLDKMMNEAKKSIADEYRLITAIEKYDFEADDPYISSDKNGNAVVDFAVFASNEICREMVDRTKVLTENGYSSYDEMLNNYDCLNIYAAVHEDDSVTAVMGISGTDYYEDIPLTMKEQAFIRETIGDICKSKDKTLDDLMTEAIEETKEEHSKPAPKKDRDKNSIEL